MHVTSYPNGAHMRGRIGTCPAVAIVVESWDDTGGFHPQVRTALGFIPFTLIGGDCGPDWQYAKVYFKGVSLYGVMRWDFEGPVFVLDPRHNSQVGV